MAPDFIRHGALTPVSYAEKARDPRGSHMSEANSFFPFPSLPHPHQVGRQAAYGVDRGGGRHPSGGGERGGRPPSASQQLESTRRRCRPISGSWQDISTQPIQYHKPNNQISQKRTIEQKFQKQNTIGRQRENFNSHGGGPTWTTDKQAQNRPLSAAPPQTPPPLLNLLLLKRNLHSGQKP